jgi:hypothetical protein
MIESLHPMFVINRSAVPVMSGVEAVYLHPQCRYQRHLFAA